MNIWRKLAQFVVRSTSTEMAKPIQQVPFRDMIQGYVERTSTLSLTVRGMELKFPKPIQFKAGQWVDLLVPGSDTLSGFSICSAPYESDRSGTINLAVKKSDNPGSMWCHTCQLKADVAVKVGGEFYFEPENDWLTKKLVFVGGGVGINPLFSMIKETLYLDERNGMKRKIILLYSATNEFELLFKEDFFVLASKYKNIFEPVFFVTGDDGLSKGNFFFRRRINETDIKKAIDNVELTKVFVCGPERLLEYVLKSLNKLQFPQERIFYEKWWDDEYEKAVQM